MLIAMKNLFTSLLLLYYAAGTLAQPNNTLLFPRLLSEEEIKVVLKGIQSMEEKYDPDFQLLWSMASPHYHSDLKKSTRVHSVRSDEYLNLSWENLEIKALVKPYSETATLILK
jgi:hypothetical protein